MRYQGKEIRGSALIHYRDGQGESLSEDT